MQPNALSDEEPLELLKLMRHHKLVRHADGCSWARSPSWQAKLRALWNGLELAQRDWSPALEQRDQDRLARVVAARIDTWYLNWLTDEGLPPALERRLDDLQAEARENATEWETPWRFDGVPLLMYQHGSGSKGHKRHKGQQGVSWVFILRNASLALGIRRTPLGSVIAKARLGSECLWRLTPRRALDDLKELLRRMWGTQRGRLQVSELHLAADVVNLPLTDDSLSRFVSRSRKQARYEAARADMAKPLHSLRTPEIDGMDGVYEFDEIYEMDDMDMGVDRDAEFDGADEDAFGETPSRMTTVWRQS